jgi:putative multiple sugar transport system ATP-binding protein
MDDIKQNITLANLKKIASNQVVNNYEENVVAEEYRKKMNIKTPSVTQTVGNLSGGNQQKVVLSKWMFSEPDLLILDEPTRGIDVGAKYEIYTIINQLADQGKGVLVISSELPEIIGMCDRIYVMNEGEITGEVDKSEATQETLMKYMTKSRG